jgi:hypothetical protein
MRRSYDVARKTIKKAMKQAVPGTKTFLDHAQAMVALDSKERAEEISLGLSPENLGSVIQTRYVYVAHCPVLRTDASNEEVAAAVKERDEKARHGLHMEPEDIEGRRKLDEEFGDERH